MNYSVAMIPSRVRRVIPSILLGLGCLAGPSPLFAGLAIDPLRTELQSPPGTTVTGSVTVRNAKEDAIQLQTRFTDHSLHPVPGWMNIETNARTLGPNETSVFNYTLTIPPEARGEFYGRLGFAEAPEQQAPSMVGIRTEISIPIYVTFTGTEEYRGAITDVRVKSADPLKLTVKVEHQGNAHLRARGECLLSDPATGETLRRIVVNEQGVPIYPGRADNELYAIADQPLPPGSYDCRVTLPFPDADRPLVSQTQIHIEEPQPTGK